MSKVKTTKAILPTDNETRTKLLRFWVNVPFQVNSVINVTLKMCVFFKHFISDKLT